MRHLVISFAVMAILLLPVNPAFADQDSEEARAQAELEELQSQIGELRQQLRRDRRDRDQLTRQLQNIESAVGRIARRLREIESDMQSQQSRLEDLQAQREQRRTELAADRHALGEHLREAYMTGRRGRLRMLLNQEDPAAVGRVMAYYDYINRARTQRIRSLSERLRVLTELEEQIIQRRDKLAQLRQQQRDTLGNLQATRDERAQLLVKLEERIAGRDQQLEQLLEDEQRLQRLVQSVQKTLADVPDNLGRHRDFANLRGQLPLPVDGTIVRRFGAPRHNGRLRSRGMLIRAEQGSDVIAISRGRIAFAEWLPNYGLLLIVEHGDGFMSLYGHTREVFRQVGEWVDAGDVIASVGDSGGQPEPALYFEIRDGREPVDPAPWLRARR